MIVDLRSDTFSLPSSEMRDVIARAEVGDEYYGEDASVRRLEAACKDLTGKEDALFCTTGMLANQLAIASQTYPGDEVITEYGYHVNLYESGQYARFCQVVLNARETADGVLRVSDVERAIVSKPRELTYSQVALVALENTISSRQGKIYPLQELENIRLFTRQRAIRMHLDGARLWNAHVRTKIPLTAYAQQTDTLSISFSKGLGAPIGSVLLGPADAIERARRLRVWHGSGFHQIGFCAEAARFSLTRQLERLEEDHRLTALLANLLAGEPTLGVRSEAIETNIIHLDFRGRTTTAEEFRILCEENGVLAFTVPINCLRLVVCRNVDEDGIRAAAHTICCLSRRLA
jgi:threonine aldolase